MKPKNLDTRANKKIFIIASVILIGIIMIVAMIYKSSSTKEIIQGQESKSLSQEDENSFDYGTEKGKVIIMYQDEDGNKIAENDEIEGIVGKEYTTSRKEISHYVAAKKDPLNKIGNYKKEDITVVYQYKLIQNLVKTNVSEGNNVTIQIGNERQSRDYKLVLMQETEEGKKLTGGKFKIQSDITVDGTTTNGKLTIGAINVQSEGTENYTITEEEAPQGFEKTLTSNYVLQIQKKYNNENKQYELIATSQNNELELEQTQNDEILLTIKNKKIQTNEIALKKILTSINDTQTKKEVTARIENGKVVYDKSEEPLEVKKGEKIVYTIRVYNEGNQDIVGKTVEDIIPDGLKYLSDSKINKDYKWEEENNLVKTNYLVGKTIKGFEIENNEKPLYEDIKIELEVIKEEGTIINTAKTESLENEKDINNNEDEEKAKIIKDEPKTFDLSMQKYLYSIDGEKLTNKEIVAKNIEGKIEYTKNNEICKVANNQKLVFTLRIFNEGEKQTLGRDAYEYIPEGLEFITDSTINKENEWKMYKQDKAGNLVEVENIKDATVLKTDKLRNEQIDGFDINNNELPKYKDIQIEFKVNENKVKDENRVITNIAKIESTRLEKNQENDKSEEKVQVKQFDLELVKYIKEIKIKDDLGETVTSLGLGEKNQIFKKEINSKKISKTQIYVTYGLKVKNIGEIAGYASEISDYIPKDFELVNDSIWKNNGNVVTTTSLAKKIINPGESKNLEITFKWNLNANSIGERNNKAVISKYENDYNAKDNTEDNKNEERFIISIKTGAFEISIFIILTILIISVVVIKIKIKNKKGESK